MTPSAISRDDLVSAMAASSPLVIAQVPGIGNEVGNGSLRLFIDRHFEIAGRLLHRLRMRHEQLVGLAGNLFKVCSAGKQKPDQDCKPGIGTENCGNHFSVIVHFHTPSSKGGDAE